MPRSYNRSVCTEEWHDKAVRGAALTGLGFAALLCVIGGMVVVPFLMRSLHDPGIIDTAPGKKSTAAARIVRGQVLLTTEARRQERCRIQCL